MKDSVKGQNEQDHEQGKILELDFQDLIRSLKILMQGIQYQYLMLQVTLRK